MSTQGGGDAQASPERGPKTFDDDDVFDLLRGVAALTCSPAVEDLAFAIGTAPNRGLANAFNAKQIGSKLWLVDCLASTFGRDVGRVLVVGGWHGVLSSLLLDDERLSIAHATSLDRDPACAATARAVNRRHVMAGRFAAVTGDMYDFGYRQNGEPGYDLVVNTSCEHIADLRAWLAMLPAGTRVVLQSNDYRREPDHIACVDSLAAFEAQAALPVVDFRGERPTKNYRRFMLIGNV